MDLEEKLRSLLAPESTASSAPALPRSTNWQISLGVRRDDVLLRTEEVAQYVGLTVDTLTRYRSRGKGPRFVLISGTKHVRYRLGDVQTWLDRKSVDPAKRFTMRRPSRRRGLRRYADHE